MDAYVEILHPDGRKERFPIEGEQTTIGKSGTAGISLPTSSELELEHLLVAPRGRAGCWVSTSQGARTPTVVKGKEFVSGMVPWGTEVKIGDVRITLTDRKPGATSGPSSRLVILGVALILAVGALSLIPEPEDSLPSGADLEPPDLFATVESECGEGDPTVLGPDYEYQAHSRGDRYSYDPQDGVNAVSLYARASDCYTRAGMSDEATAMTESREEMQRTVNADYAARRLRLHHSLSVEDWKSVEMETAALVKLTADVDPEDSYVVWLERVLRIARANARYKPPEDEATE